MQNLPKDIGEAVQFFFREPSESEDPVYYGTLYLLRRDIFTAFGHNPADGSSNTSTTIWLGVMGIMAGIDLLAKFAAGKDNGSSGKRFKDYLELYLHMQDEDDRETIYHLRNSLLHSFGWYSAKYNKHGRITKEYRFALNMERGAPIITQVREGVYVIAVEALHKLFESSIYEYKTTLAGEPAARFCTMFSKYGWTRIGPKQ